MALASLLNLRVFRHIVYEKGLAYLSVAEFSPMVSAGAFSLTLGYSPARESEVYAAVSEEISILAGSAPSDTELSGVKGFLKGFQAISIELPEDKVARFGQWEMTGCGYDFLPAFNASVDSATPAGILNLAQRVFAEGSVLQIVVNGG